LAELADDPAALRAEVAKALKSKRFDDAEGAARALSKHPGEAEYAESALRRLELARKRSEP
jgi:hypothetical protein